MDSLLLRSRSPDGTVTVARRGCEELLPLLTGPHGCAGRGSPAIVSLPGGGSAVRKHYFRGGCAGFLRDRYRSWKRLENELGILEFLEGRGAPVPQVLAARAARDRWGWYSLDLLLREIPGAERMSDLLRRWSGRRRARLLREAAAAVRSLHDLGVYHGDLNVENILHSPSGIHLVDFDQAKRKEPDVSMRIRDLRRLHRSAIKRRLPLYRTDLVRFALSYSGEDATLIGGVVGWMPGR